MDDATSKLIGTDEAAEYLGVARSTVTRWAQSGALKPLHQTSGLRGAYVFDRADIEARKLSDVAGTDARR